MIVADTNVLSELMRPCPSASVLRWTGSLPPNTLFTTAVTKAEILVGLALLPPGRRRDDLEAAATRMFGRLFTGRVLPFDEAAAERFAIVTATRRSLGRPIEVLDAQIAAIALTKDATFATRNIADFEGIGLDLCNPWDTIAR